MSASMPPVQTDLAEVFPDLMTIRARAQGGDLPGALAEVRARSTGLAEDVITVTELVAESEGIDDDLAAHLRAHPDDRLARTLDAHRTILSAGSAADPAASTRADSAADLATAEQTLIRLCAEDPTDRYAWYLRLVTARGLGLGWSESRRRYRRLAAVDPHHAPAQRQILRSLQPRWGGSWEAAFGYAREVSATGAEGSVEGALVVTAHLDRWLAEGGGGQNDYLLQPEVLAELDDASDRLLAVPPPSTYAWVQPHTEIAVLLGVAGRRVRAGQHFSALGPALAEGPWAAAARYQQDLQTMRASVLAEGRRR